MEQCAEHRNNTGILTGQIFIICLVLLVAVIPGRGAAAAQCPDFKNPVPTYVSPEAKEFIAGLPDPGTYPTGPAANDLEGWRALHAAGEERARPKMEAIRKQYSPVLADAEYEGVPVLDIRPRGWKDDGRVLVFVHGGGYTMNSVHSSLAASVPLADATNMRVVAVNYTKAPFAKYSVMLDQVIAVIRHLQNEGYAPANIGLVGVSAGGGIAVGSVLKMRDRKMPTVGAIVLWSPAADLTMKGETVTTLACYELAFAADEEKMSRMMDVVAPKEELTNPYASPVFGQYSPDFPPVLIQGGTREVLLSGFVLLYQAIDTAGGIARLDLYEGMVHTFQEVNPDLPESRLAREKTSRFLNLYIKK